MRFFHISDLHLGKRLHEFSLIEDQQYILDEICCLTKKHSPNAVLISGDVYDKPIPTGEAVALFDSFLSRLVNLGVLVFIISGNHDSAERLSFGASLMTKSGVYISPNYSGDAEKITLTDEYGQVNVHLLPFIKPQTVRGFFEEEVTDYTDALSAAISRINPDTSKRNILLAHQFVTGALRTESEEISVGGTDNVNAKVFYNFDYVALGHLHSPQSCDRPQIRYSGSILKYSFSEAKDQKSITVVDLLEKGKVNIFTLPLRPIRDMTVLRGKYTEIMSRDFYLEKSYHEDYVNVVLTDEEDIIDVSAKLRTVYKNLMHVEYDNARTRGVSSLTQLADESEPSPLELFAELFRLQNNKKMSTEQEKIISGVIERLTEDRI